MTKDGFTEVPFVPESMIEEPLVRFSFKNRSSGLEYTWCEGSKGIILFDDSTSIEDWEKAIDKIKNDVVTKLKQDSNKYDLDATLEKSNLFCDFRSKTVKQILDEIE